MCQATAYMTIGEDRREIMRDIISLVSGQDGVQLETFFEEPQIVRARVTKIDFLKHSITLVPLDGEGE